jgi:hypothetical protein
VPHTPGSDGFINVGIGFGVEEERGDVRNGGGGGARPGASGAGWRRGHSHRAGRWIIANGSGNAH